MIDFIYVGNYAPQIGGAAISCHQILCELCRRACRGRVLASVTEAAREQTLAFDAASAELEFRRFNVPYYFNAPYRPAPEDWTAASEVGVRTWLETMIAERAPDLLLVREGWIPFTNPVAEKHRIPTIALVRGNPTSAILSDTFPEAPGKAYLDELRRADLIITVAEHFLPGLARLGIRNCRSIPNAVDLAAFAPREPDAELVKRFGIAESDVVALHAAHIEMNKRPLDIVRSAPAVLRENRNVLYVIVGEGSVRADMRRLAGEFGVSNRFRFQDFVTYDQMPRYMSLADIVLMPSEREGLARVYLEAQAGGKTLIASDIPAAREVVTHGETGLLFRKGDVEDLAAQTLLAAGDAKLRDEIGRRALERVQENSLARAGELYLEAAQEVAGTD